MNRWSELRDEYTAWLRAFPMLVNMGQPGGSPEILGPTDEPAALDVPFWSARTREAEAHTLRHLTDPELDGIIDSVAAIIDENLRRFDPLVAYFGRFAPDGDPDRIECERDAAHSIKRDLAWAACEQAIGEPGFFCGLLPWYDRGRWPVGWSGHYPAGHVRVV
jgi:hypothetical protein